MLFFQMRLLILVLTMAKELSLSSWMMSDVLAQRADWLTVPTLLLTTVSTLKMLLLAAQQVCNELANITCLNLLVVAHAKHLHKTFDC